MTAASFYTQSIRACHQGDAVARILAAAIQAVDPGNSVQRYIQRIGNALQIGEQSYRLDNFRQIRILGIGKAAEGMAVALSALLAGFSYQGLLVPKHAPSQNLPGFVALPGGHPVPDEQSLIAGERALQLVSDLSEDDLLICLVSGGGSALMAAPLPGITLADMQALTSLMLQCGARIDEINTLRRHIDLLKGGGLARLTAPARIVSLILSDVVNNPLEAIASGPTAPDPSSLDDVQGILDKYAIRKQVPRSILVALESAAESPKPGALLFESVQNLVIGSNVQAVQAAVQQAQQEGFSARSLGCHWQGEARQVGQTLSQMLKNTPDARPFCLVAGGETTVTLRGNGRGGRNQELALGSVTDLAGLPNVMVVALATDGEDGPTDAAGAAVTGDTFRRGHEIGLQPAAYLDNNDAYTYFNDLADLLKPGPTGTNVNDLTLMFGF